jgi:alpha,alpha-trehalose-phosphate synthase [UDP-forming]
MVITIRLIISLLLAIALVSLAFSYFQVQAEKDRLASELDRSAIILAESLQESIIPIMQSDSLQRMKNIVEKFGNRKRLKGVAVFDTRGALLASTPGLEKEIPQPFPQAVNSIAERRPLNGFMNVSGKKTFIHTSPLIAEDFPLGALTIFHDASYIDARLVEIWKNNMLRFLLQSIFIVVITLLIIRWSITGPVAQIAALMKKVRTGKSEIIPPMVSPRGDILAPLISEVEVLAKSLSLERARAEEEARLRLKGDSVWTAHRLKEFVRAELGDKRLFLVSNREPYMHIKDGRTIRYITPAGGLVSALDPVMRICDGIWIAHGGGSADRDTVDADDKLRVPPDEGSYSLRRIWLDKDEENGYYYGFSNEGLWPLCHISHIRPIFRRDDWEHYQRVNAKFAEAVLKEIAHEDSPLILIQDYHLALLPCLVKEKRRDAKIALFWHIPWPNPESFSICPWRQEIMIGMLGADILGFHIQFFCNNFLDTVNRFLESKIDWDQFSVKRGNQTTEVKPFPISVSFENGAEPAAAAREREVLREAVLKDMDLKAKFLGIGVERIDYTKGIPERLMAINVFLEKYPEFIGTFTFIQIGAPSRTHLARYRDLMQEIEEIVERINWRFNAKGWMPIVYLEEHHSHEEIERLYRVADMCMVTSLHDGMNLVAKEFVASRHDEDGVLILSQFAGASRELKDAIIVNPYDTEEMADAIHLSLTMNAAERTERMKRMRATVKEHNIYRWAGNLISTLSRLRVPERAHQRAQSPME